MGGLDRTGAYVHTAQARHNADAFLRFVAARLVASGYAMGAQGAGWFSAQSFAANHTMTVASDGWTATFTVRSPGLTFAVVPALNAAIAETMHAFDTWLAQQQQQPSQRAPVSYHLVERQVVVTRCRFCRAHTPIDAPTCQHCGAAAFS